MKRFTKVVADRRQRPAPGPLREGFCDKSHAQYRARHEKNSGDANLVELQALVCCQTGKIDELT